MVDMSEQARFVQSDTDPPTTVMMRNDEDRQGRHVF